jgi:hypothetical protein
VLGHLVVSMSEQPLRSAYALAEELLRAEVAFLHSLAAAEAVDASVLDGSVRLVKGLVAALDMRSVGCGGTPSLIQLLLEYYLFPEALQSRVGVPWLASRPRAALRPALPGRAAAGGVVWSEGAGAIPGRRLAAAPGCCAWLLRLAPTAPLPPRPRRRWRTRWWRRARSAGWSAAARCPGRASRCTSC